MKVTDPWMALASGDECAQVLAISHFRDFPQEFCLDLAEKCFDEAQDRFRQIAFLRLTEGLSPKFATKFFARAIKGRTHPQVKFEACLSLIDRDALAARGVLAKFRRRKWAIIASRYLEFRTKKSDVVELLAVAMEPKNLADSYWSSIRKRVEPEIAAHLEQNPERRRDHYFALLASVELDDSAFEYFMARPSEISLEELVRIYADVPGMVRRCEVIEIVGQKPGLEPTQFLVQVARSRANSVVRYYAMLALIRRGSLDWRPRNTRQLRTPLYASLTVYEQYIKGDIPLSEVRARAAKHSTWPGDHWAWLRELEEEPTMPPKC